MERLFTNREADREERRSLCSAIEYFLSEEYGFMLTQGELAGKYEVTQATIARRFKELCAFVEEHTVGGTNEMLPPEIVIGSLKGSDKEKAEELVYRAMEAGSPKSRSQLAKAALEFDPDSAGAYLILADEAENEDEARALLKAGMEAGRRELGSAFFAENKGYFWGFPRPVLIYGCAQAMRIRAGSPGLRTKPPKSWSIFWSSIQMITQARVIYCLPFICTATV